MKLIITRHGETIDNAKRIYQGHTQGKLSELGIQQAKKLAERLKDEKIDVIYCSDLQRAKDTATKIAKYHQQIPIHYVKELRPRDFGPYTGGKWDTIDWENPPPEIESRESVQKRIKPLLDKVYDQHKNDTVLFVGHAGSKKNLLRIIMGDKAPKTLENTSLTIVEFDENKNHKIHLLNCTEHLK